MPPRGLLWGLGIVVRQWDGLMLGLAALPWPLQSISLQNGFLPELQALWSCSWGMWADRDHGNSGGPTVSWRSGGQPRGTTVTIPPSHHPCLQQEAMAGVCVLLRLGQAYSSLLPQKPHVLFSESKQICYFTKNVF